jgi:hypothetical protein
MSHTDQLSVKFSLIRDVQPERRGLSEGVVEVTSGQERSIKGRLFRQAMEGNYDRSR